MTTTRQCPVRPKGGKGRLHWLRLHLLMCLLGGISCTVFAVVITFAWLAVSPAGSIDFGDGITHLYIKKWFNGNGSIGFIVRVGWLVLIAPTLIWAVLASLFAAWGTIFPRPDIDELDPPDEGGMSPPSCGQLT